MFSSTVPGIPANMAFVHNPSSKSSNHYVNSSTNPNLNVAYLANPNLYDMGYLSVLPSDGSLPNWYPNNSYRPPYGQDYAIYSAPNPFNYDHSAPFLDFEDSFTDSTASPALSTASLEALKSPVDDESLIDELDTPQPDNRAIQTGFPLPIPFQPGDMDDMPRALYLPPSVDDSQSTISELEVDERERIAKINAEYNATSHSGFYRNDNSPPQVPKYSAFRESNATLQISSMQPRPCLRLIASQPRHPDLHFPPRPAGNEKQDLPSSSYQIYANPVPLDLSPPSVERLPSQLPAEQNMGTNRDFVQSSSSSPSRSHERTSDRSRISQNRTSSPIGFIHSVSQAGQLTSVGISPQSLSDTSRGEHLKLAPSSVIPAENTRKHRSSVLIANGHSSQPLASDVQETLKYKQQSPASSTSSMQPSANVKNQVPSYNASPDSRQNAEVFKSSPLTEVNNAPEIESTERISVGSNLRRDTKTPGPFGRGHSYIRSSLDSPSSSSQDVHSNLDRRDQEVYKSSPKSFLDDKSGHLDNGQSPSDAIFSSSLLLREQSSSVSQSISSLPREGYTTKNTDDARESELSRRLRSTGTERVASSTHSQSSPLRLSPESSLAAFPQPDSQVASAVIVSEPRSAYLNHSRTVTDPAGLAISLDSRESTKVREPKYFISAKSQLETSQREGKDARMPPSVLQSSPVTKIATTSGSPSSKPALDSVPAHPEPHRRRSDGDQVGPPIRPILCGRNSAPLIRSVRWTDNLIAPSPILGPPRRKGWFNRRGDQLWTNSGDYRPPRAGEEYPLDLNDYPKPGDGWMNEDGIRIDMSHRRIPKALPRPVLKKP